MKAIGVLSSAVLFVVLGAASGQEPKPQRKPQAKKPDAAQAFERLDKNNDGSLSKDELPERLQQAFDRIDQNNDGKIGKDEFQRVAERLAGKPGLKPEAKPAMERLQALLKRLDGNNDGKITRSEAQGPLADNFDRIDRNKDGVLDKEELAAGLERLGNKPRKPDKPNKPTTPPPTDKPKKPDEGKPRAAETPRVPAVDFDRLDRDVDGRLTRDEFKASGLADKFDQIDSNKDGKIDPRELEAFVNKK